jgi:predicted phosphodiesterase
LLNFLQLSDIHFRERRSDQQGRPLANDHVAQDYAQRELLIEDARSVGKELGGYSAVLVAGDISDTGGAGQFSQATVWLRNLCTAIDVKPWMVWTVPGNHDVEDDDIKRLGYELRSRLRETDPETLDAIFAQMLGRPSEADELLRPLLNYIQFAESFECAFDASQLHWTADLPLAHGYPLQLRGLSSPLLCAKGDTREKRLTIIGKAQADDWPAEMIHLSMCHHPAVGLLDHQHLDDLFGENVQVRVTGHLHTRSLSCTGTGLYLQAGAVSPNRREDGGYAEGYEPAYDVITLEQVACEEQPYLEIGVHPRYWDDKDKAWRGRVAEVRRFALGHDARPQDVDSPVIRSAQQPEPPLRETRYKLAQMPDTDRFACLEEIGAPISQFLDLPEVRIVSAILLWAGENKKLDALIDAVAAKNP